MIVDLAEKTLDIVLDGAIDGFRKYIGDQKANKLIELLEQEIYNYLLNQTGDEVFYNELDAFLRSSKSIGKLIERYLQIDESDFRTSDKIVTEIITEMTDNYGLPLGVKAQIKDLLTNIISIIDKRLNQPIDDEQRKTFTEIRKARNYIIDKLEDVDFTIQNIDKGISEIRKTISDQHSRLGLTLIDFWDDWTKTTKPNLTSGFFLAGREENQKSILKWLEKKAGNLFVQAETQEEALLFFVSTVLSSSEELQEQILKCCLIIDDIDNWKNIINLNNKDIILIPYFKGLDEVRLPHDITAILPVSKYDFKSSNKPDTDIIYLIRQNKTSFSKALESIEIETSDIYDYAFKTKRRFLALYRLITTLPQRQRPRWVNKYEMSELIPALLAGGWNENKSGDTEVLSKIANCSYEQYVKTISHWLDLEDSPIIKVGSTYQIVSVQDMWDYLWNYILKSDYERFCECILLILSAKNPKYELPEKDWFAASIYGKDTNYSEVLQENLIVSLIMLSLGDSQQNNFNVVSTKRDVDYLVKQIMDSIKDWREWFSIASLLPLLAEASPEAMITKFEEYTVDNENSFWALFRKPSDSLFGTNYYTHILWALEKLVWNKSYAFRAIIILARISERNFEYTIVNSPLNSMYEIFCLWHPQSALSLKEKMQILNYIMEKFPNTGWKLFDKLLPSGPSLICGNILTPTWQEWDDNIEWEVTHIELQEQIKTLVNVVLKKITPEAAKWHIIFENIDSFILNIDDICFKLEEHNSLFLDYDRYEISNELRKLISNHRHFAYADWSMNEEEIVKLEKALFIIEPKDSRIKYKHLFSNDPALLKPYVYEDCEKYDWNEELRIINEAREKALVQVFKDYGIDGILELVSDAEEGFNTGSILAEKILTLEINWDVLYKLIKNDKKGIASAVMTQIYRKKGMAYILSSLRDNLSRFEDDDIAQLLCLLPLSTEVWDAAEAFGENISGMYWDNINVIGNRDLSEAMHIIIIQKLLSNNRPFSIMKSIPYSDFSNTHMIIETLEMGMQLASHKESNGLSLNHFNSSEIVRIFKKLYDDKNIDNEKVAYLELSYLPYFKNHGKPLCLFNEISKNPLLYVQLICLAYNNKESGPDELGEKERQRARRAYEILQMYKSLPGLGTGNVNKDIFNNWMYKVLTESKLHGRVDVAERLVGKLLSYSPIGEDGIWPHEIVRDFIELHGTQRMVNNFIIGKENQRGVHSITGGLQEKKIAQEYKEKSEAIQFLYPRTSVILKRISEDYLGDARYDEMREEMDYI
jgi:hypothetical protein